MVGSSILAPRRRARSPISLARMTAPSRLEHVLPSGPGSTSSLSAGLVSSATPPSPMTSADRRMPSRASAPNQTRARPRRGRRRPTAPRASSGIRSRSAPGASLTPVGSRSRSPKAKSSDGDQSAGCLSRCRQIAAPDLGRPRRHRPSRAARHRRARPTRSSMGRGQRRRWPRSTSSRSTAVTSRPRMR